MKQNRTAWNAPAAGSLAIGAAVSMVVTLVCAAASAAMISAGKIGENAMGYLSIGTQLLAASIGALIGAGGAKEKKMLVSLMIVGVYFGLLVSANALFFDGRYERVTVTSFVLFLGAIGGTLLGKGKGGGGSFRKRRIKHR